MARLWLRCFPPVESASEQSTLRLLHEAGLDVTRSFDERISGAVALVGSVSAEVVDWLRLASREATIIAIVLAESAPPVEQIWKLMAAGASDVLTWRALPRSAPDVAARFDRSRKVGDAMQSPIVRQCVVGESARWRVLLREIVEVAAFTDASTLILGESGTGKELLAQLIHDLDPRQDKGELVIVDCTTIAPELAGSEFFGHERGAFTGAVGSRDGAFALANGGTLLLDEVGELRLPLQAQLLRVVQEHKYKRVGSNVWQHTEFRLICATNRDLEACVAAGGFRGDLYHRIAGWVCRVPSLRERPDDILPLATHFLAQLNHPAVAPELDESVRQYLLTRNYPGNVRDLRQLVTRIWHRHTGPGPITPGAIPPTDRPQQATTEFPWPDAHFETAIRHALNLRVGLKEISRATADTAIRIALEQEHENVHRAAVRLGVTDRAVQLRRAGRRPLH